MKYNKEDATFEKVADFIANVKAADVRYWKESNHDYPWDDVSKLYCGDIRNRSYFYPDENPIEIYEAPYSGGSDYSDCCAVEKANYRVWLELEHPAVKGMYGDFSGFGIYIRLDRIDDQIIEMLDHLENYSPRLDQEAVSEVERELEDEYWEDELKEDFRSKLISVIEDKLEELDETFDAEFQHYYFEAQAEKENQLLEQKRAEYAQAIHTLEEMEDEKLCRAFRTLCDESEEYMEIQAGLSVYIDLDRVVAKFDADEFLQGFRYHNPDQLTLNFNESEDKANEERI